MKILFRTYSVQDVRLCNAKAESIFETYFENVVGVFLFFGNDGKI